MSPFIETMAVEQGSINNFEYHVRRFEETYKAHWETSCPYSFIGNSEKVLRDNYTRIHGKELWKLRVVYDAQTMQTSLTPYTIRHITELIPVFSETIEYPFKSEDRRALNQLKENIAYNEEILIIKNGLVTDTSFTNVVVYNGKEYVTPRKPLLPGTRRASLLDSGNIIEGDIRYGEWNRFREIHLINAFMGLGDMVISIKK